jgi:hypothetical protein
MNESALFSSCDDDISELRETSVSYRYICRFSISFVVQTYIILYTDNAQVVDLVLMVREAADMQLDHDMIRRHAGDIFETLRNETGGSFRVGLVGFGSRLNNGLPRRLGTLTDDLSFFNQALDLLSHDEPAEFAPAFRTIIGSRLGLDSGADYLDGSYQGRTFPGAHGFCALMLTDAPTTGDGPTFGSASAVTEALMGSSSSSDTSSSASEPAPTLRNTSRRPSPLFAIVPESELLAATNPNSFGAIASQTGGSAFAMSNFRASDEAAATVLSQTCTDCTGKFPTLSPPSLSCKVLQRAAVMQPF